MAFILCSIIVSQNSIIPLIWSLRLNHIKSHKNAIKIMYCNLLLEDKKIKKDLLCMIYE